MKKYVAIGEETISKPKKHGRIWRVGFFESKELAEKACKVQSENGVVYEFYVQELNET